MSTKNAFSKTSSICTAAMQHAPQQNMMSAWLVIVHSLHQTHAHSGKVLYRPGVVHKSRRTSCATIAHNILAVQLKDQFSSQSSTGPATTDGCSVDRRMPALTHSKHVTEHETQCRHAYIWCVPHVVHSAQELAVAGGVRRLIACHLTVRTTQLQRMPSDPCGFWVLTTANSTSCKLACGFRAGL